MYLGRNHSWVPLVKPQYGKTFSRRNVYIPQVVIPVRQGNSHDSHERRVYAHRLIDFYKVYQNMRWKGTKIQTFEGAPSSSNISMNPRIVTSIQTVWESLMFLILTFFQASEPMVARVPVTSISWTDLRPSQESGSTFCCAKRGGKLCELLRQLMSFVFTSVIAELYARSLIAKKIWLF